VGPLNGDNHEISYEKLAFEYINKSLDLSKKGKYDESESCFYDFFELDPEFLALWVDKFLQELPQLKLESLFLQTFEVGDTDYEKHIEIFNEALKIHPRSSRALIWKGIRFDRLGKTSEALSNYKKALLIEPRSPIILANLVRLAKMGRQFNEALFWFDRLISLDWNKEIAVKRKNELLDFMKRGRIK